MLISTVNAGHGCSIAIGWILFLSVLFIAWCLFCFFALYGGEAAMAAEKRRKKKQSEGTR